LNGWLLSGEIPANHVPGPADQVEQAHAFRREGEIEQPTLTPVLGDSIYWYAWPLADDFPPLNLNEPTWTPSMTKSPGPITRFIIPRHGSRPNRVPNKWPPTQRLPGSINVSFFDGHSEIVLLERLWQLYWHRDYQPPAKRPGLP